MTTGRESRLARALARFCGVMVVLFPCLLMLAACIWAGSLVFRLLGML